MEISLPLTDQVKDLLHPKKIVADKIGSNEFLDFL